MSRGRPLILRGERCEAGYAFKYHQGGEAGTDAHVGHLEQRSPGDSSSRKPAVAPAGQGQSRSPPNLHSAGGHKSHRLPPPSTRSPSVPLTPASSPPPKRHKQVTQKPLSPPAAPPNPTLSPPPPPLMELNISRPQIASKTVDSTHSALVNKCQTSPASPKVVPRSSSKPWLVSLSPHPGHPLTQFEVVAAVDSPKRRYQWLVSTQSDHQVALTLSRPHSSPEVKGDPIQSWRVESPEWLRGQVVAPRPYVVPSLASVTRHLFPDP